jgi:hypothetical protein
MKNKDFFTIQMVTSGKLQVDVDEEIMCGLGSVHR